VRVNFVANIHRADALDAAVSAGCWLTDKGHEVFVDTETGRHLSLPSVPNDQFSQADLVVAFGGDGTLIRAAHLCAEAGTPILGVYYGRFGFVTQCTRHRFKECITAFLAGDMAVESRMMIEADLVRNGRVIANVLALNEIVLQRSTTARMMTFAVSVDGHHLTRYPADGILVTTPTGSTAYNLSAGGPIMDPSVVAINITPIAAHTLTSRSLILNANATVRLEVQNAEEAVLSADGQNRLHILGGDEVFARRSERVTNLLTVSKDDFLMKLGQRVFSGGELLGEEP
jgi:NAD+ kinase